MKTIKDIKAMMKEPASKEWFAKHGSPKSKALHAAKKLSNHDSLRAALDKSYDNQKKGKSGMIDVDKNDRSIMRKMNRK